MNPTQHHTMDVKKNRVALFSVAGLPFGLPIAWIESESRSVYNSVNQVDNPKWLPPISLTGISLIITANIPTQIINNVAEKSISMLKIYLTRNAELWASDKYDDVDLETHRTPLIGLNGEVVTPNPDSGHYTPFGNVKLPWYLPMITGYIGGSNYILGGFVEQFTSKYNPRTTMDSWTIGIQGINISALRKDAPNPEAPEPDPETPLPDSQFVVGSKTGSLLLPNRQ